MSVGQKVDRIIFDETSIGEVPNTISFREQERWFRKKSPVLSLRA